MAEADDVEEETIMWKMKVEDEKVEEGLRKGRKELKAAVAAS